MAFFSLFLRLFISQFFCTWPSLSPPPNSMEFHFCALEKHNRYRANEPIYDHVWKNKYVVRVHSIQFDSWFCYACFCVSTSPRARLLSNRKFECGSHRMNMEQRIQDTHKSMGKKANRRHCCLFFFILFHLHFRFQPHSV